MPVAGIVRTAVALGGLFVLGWLLRQHHGTYRHLLRWCGVTAFLLGLACMEWALWTETLRPAAFLLRSFGGGALFLVGFCVLLWSAPSASPARNPSATQPAHEED